MNRQEKKKKKKKKKDCCQDSPGFSMQISLENENRYGKQVKL